MQLFNETAGLHQLSVLFQTHSRLLMQTRLYNLRQLTSAPTHKVYSKWLYLNSAAVDKFTNNTERL